MKRKLYILYAVTGIVLVIAFWFVMLPPRQWLVDESMHSTMEAMEAFSVLLMALFLLFGREEEEGSKLSLPALGFLGMGILDSAHAAAGPGDSFVFLRAIASLAGGLGFALAWLPAPQQAALNRKSVVWILAAGALTVSILAYLFPMLPPPMVRQGAFTRSAVAINIAGGMLFLTGAYRFVLDLRRSDDPEDLLFSLIGVFYGLSGLTFQHSMLWSEAWWFWHALRLLASLMVLGLLMHRHLHTVTALKASLLERERAHEELNHIGRRMELILYSAGEGILGVDLRGNHTFINNAAAAMLGFEPNELIGRHSHSTYHHTRPDGAPYPPRECPIYAAYRDGTEHAGEELFWKKDGTPFFVDFTSRPIIESGRIAGAVVTFSDVTERKRTEILLRQSSQLTRTIIDSMNDAISLIDVRDFTLVSVNQVFLQKYGYSDESEIKGKHCYEITHHRTEICTAPDDLCPLLETVKTKEHFSVDHVHYGRQGEKIYVEVSTSPIKDENGNVVQVVHVSRDITERKRNEEERERLVARLARSNKELEQFAYVASHDLREPLRMVASYVRLLEQKYKGRLDEKADKYIFFAVDGALRMQKLIEGLLAYSRVSTKGAEFKRVDMNRVYAEAVANLSAVIEESRATVRSDDLPSVSGDEIQLLQLFQNLLGNAVKFRKPGTPPEVRVSVRKEMNEWVFLVRDNGIGIEKEYFDRVFQIFQRLHSQAEYPGTGIGLAVCKKIVERHQGRIWVESFPGQGTTFFFTLPAEPDVRQNVAPGKN